MITNKEKKERRKMADTQYLNPSSAITKIVNKKEIVKCLVFYYIIIISFFSGEVKFFPNKNLLL